METIFRKMIIDDKSEILSMMRDFYNSEAVYTNGSEEIYENDFLTCIKNTPYLDGYTILLDGKIAGYSMLAKSFSTEFGKNCIWFEDIYLKKEYRGLGIIPKFINYIKQEYKDTIFRLEIEKENEHALHVYKKKGFKLLPYNEMIIV